MDDDEDEPHRIQVGGSRLRWSTREGSGRPLLLINGLGANIEMWRPLRRALYRPTMAFDAPGTGESPTPAVPVGIAQLAAMVGGALDHFGVDEVDVLGYSFGGAVAQVMARQQPQRVKRLILAASTCGWGGFWIHAFAAATPRTTPARDHLRRHGDDLSRPASGDTAPASFRQLDAARSARPPSSLGYWWQMVSIAGWSSHAWLDQITQETLVLVGSRDQAAPPPTSELLAERIPNARLCVVPGAGHLLLMSDDVGAVATLIEGFLGGTLPLDQSERELAAR